MSLDLAQRSLHHHFAAMHSRAGPEIDDVIGATHRLFVVFDDDERVPLLAQRRQRLEQAKIVARMQADGRFVENIKHSAEIRTQLRRQANSLRFSATQRFGRAAQAPDIRARHFP